MKRTKYRGVVMPDVRPLTERERPLNIRKGLIPVVDDLEMEPDYVKKLKARQPGTNIVQLKLFGNPFEDEKAKDQDKEQ